MAPQELLERFQSHGFSIFELVSPNRFRIRGKRLPWMSPLECDPFGDVVELTLRPIENSVDRFPFWLCDSQLRDMGLVGVSKGAELIGEGRVFAIAVQGEKFLAIGGCEHEVAAVNTWLRKSMSCVLVAEDHAVNRRLVERILTSHGYLVTTVVDGSQAKSQLSTNEFDVVILDWKMPGMSGTDVIRELRKNGQNPNQQVPAIALTAYDCEFDREKCMSAGFNACLGKPFQLQELIETVTAFSPANGN